MENVINIYYTK